MRIYATKKFLEISSESTMSNTHILLYQRLLKDTFRRCSIICKNYQDDNLCDVTEGYDF